MKTKKEERIISITETERVAIIKEAYGRGLLAGIVSCLIVVIILVVIFS